MVNLLENIHKRQNFEKMQSEWFIRFLENIVSESDAPVVIFDELESIISPNEDPNLFLEIFLRIMDKRYFSKRIVIVLSISDQSALPSLNFIEEIWSDRKLVILSLQMEDIQTVARNHGTMWDSETKPYDIVKTKIWRDLND